MKVISFLGERFVFDEGKWKSLYSNAWFIQESFGKDSVIICGSSDDRLIKPKSFGSEIEKTYFREFERYNSTKDFLIKSIIQPSFLINFIRKCDDVISENIGEIFWVRTPSMGSLIFAQRVIKKKQYLINHLCADFRKNYLNNKYSKVERMLGPIVTYLLHALMVNIFRYPKSLNLTTGSSLEDYAREYSPCKTKQFVDITIKSDGNNMDRRVNSDDILKLLFVGRLSEDKGIYELINAVKSLDNKFKLSIVGSGPEAENLSIMVKEMDLDSSITLHGHIKNSELPNYYANADLLIVPSKNSYEGFPRVIMEGWCQGVPVIVSNVGGVNAFVKNGLNGFIIDPGNVDDLIATLASCENREVINSLREGVLSIRRRSSFEHWSRELNLYVKEMLDGVS